MKNRRIYKSDCIGDQRSKQLATDNTKRPHIPKAVQTHLWLRAGGRCEFRGCNKILYEDNVTQDPINGAHIAHIVSWTEDGPRGDKVLSPLLANDVERLWKKRLGLLAAPLEQVQRLLARPDDWKEEDGAYYNKQFPQFTLR